jgi:hypothetical protein
VDAVGDARSACSSEDGMGYLDANLFGPIDSPAAGGPSHPRMQPVKLSKCSDGVFVFKYSVKTSGLYVLWCYLSLLLISYIYIYIYIKHIIIATVITISYCINQR